MSKVEDKLSSKVIRIKDMQQEDRPRERLIKKGSKALSNMELFAIIIRTGWLKENALNLANRLLKKYNIISLSQATIGELVKIQGIGKAKACQIIACFELARRLNSYKAKKGELNPIFKSPKDVYRIFGPEMKLLKKECFKLIFLDSKNRMIRDKIISIGSLNASIVHPRELFRDAITEAAESIVIIHNHPSGDPKPSKEDLEMTERLINIGDLVGIKILDHIIIGNKSYTSFAKMGLIKD